MQEIFTHSIGNAHKRTYVHIHMYDTVISIPTYTPFYDPKQAFSFPKRLQSGRKNLLPNSGLHLGNA